MLRTVHLYGHLAAEFGPSYTLDIDTPAEAIRALCCQLPRFYQQVRKGAYEIVRGETPESGFAITEAELPMICGGPIHILPVVEGGNSKGAITAILGIVLIATAFITAGATVGFAGGLSAAMGAAVPGTAGLLTFGNIALMGGALALAGISQLLTPTPKIDNYKDREDKQTSFLFNGAFPRNEQGGPLPVIYGRWQRVAPIRVSGAVTPSNDPDDIYPGTHAVTATFSPAKSGVMSPSKLRVRHNKDASVSIASVSPYLPSTITINGTPYTFTLSGNTTQIKLESVSDDTVIAVTCLTDSAWWAAQAPNLGEGGA